MRNFNDNDAFQTAEIARTAKRLSNEALQRATFVAKDYGKRVIELSSGQSGILRQRFAAYPTLGTARFVPDSLFVDSCHVTPDEVRFVC